MRPLLFVCLALAASCASAPPEPSARAMLDERAPALLAQYNTPSVAIAYIADGRIAFTAAYGEQSPGVPATTNTLYNVASLAKPISAEIMLRAVSAGQVSLDEPMSTHWVDPDIANDPRRDSLTLRIALAHRTGFPNWRRETDGVLRFVHEPATGFHYSGEGYQYAGRYTEAAAGEAFERLAQRLVFDPIGIRNTAYTRRDWFNGRIAIPHDETGAAGEPSINDEWLAADDLYTTTGDYARFVLSVMNNEGVSAEIARERQTIADDIRAEGCGEGGLSAEDCPASVGMGLGWLVLHYEGETVLMHTGSDSGEKTLAFFVPERRIGAVVFTNSANGAKIFPDIVSALYPNPHFRALLALQAR